DLEAHVGQVIERLAEQVVGLEPKHERLQQPLAPANDANRAADMLHHQKATTRSQNSERLPGSGRRVRDRAEPEGAGDGVEALTVELQRLHIAEAEIGRMTELIRAFATELEHLGAQVDADHL